MSHNRRPTPPLQPQRNDVSTAADHSNEPLLQQHQPSPATFFSYAVQATHISVTSIASLARLLPTGILLAYQLLAPILAKNGSCKPVTWWLTLSLILFLSILCFLSSFTDSILTPDGQILNGLATCKGLWIFDSRAASISDIPQDLSSYRIVFIDFVHAMLSVLVFAAVILADKDVLGCLFPMAGDETKDILNFAAVGLGLLITFLFFIFPNRRQGIGYPPVIPQRQGNGSGKSGVEAGSNHPNNNNSLRFKERTVDQQTVKEVIQKGDETSTKESTTFHERE